MPTRKAAPMPPPPPPTPPTPPPPTPEPDNQIASPSPMSVRFGMMRTLRVGARATMDTVHKVRALQTVDYQLQQGLKDIDDEKRPVALVFLPPSLNELDAIQDALRQAAKLACEAVADMIDRRSVVADGPVGDVLDALANDVRAIWPSKDENAAETITTWQAAR